MNSQRPITLVEVGPRDGLQNECTTLSTAVKIEFIERLAQTGLSVIEATSFVSPQRIPQLADHAELMQDLKRAPQVRYPVLVPNLAGLEQALAAKVTDIAFFTAASDTFSQRNTNCTIAEGLQRIDDMLQRLRQTAEPIRVRAYISCVVDCPFEGRIEPEKVAHIAGRLLELGCEEISLGETLGTASAKQVQDLLDAVTSNVPAEQLAVHFHDTYGQALTNIFVSLPYGIRVIDCAVAGLGGCPYAPGASGNVATEDVVYLLNGLGIDTGVDLDKLIQVGEYICQQLGHQTRSRVAQALLQKHKAK